MVEPLENCKPIGSKWVLKVKHTSDEKIECFKGRLVAKGYAKKFGVDYDETFSPVVRFTAIQALLAYAVQNDMLIHQMDVVTVFLNRTVEEDIYMSQPDGYVKPRNEHLVCKLKKSLYGLKQSPRCWNTVIQDHMRKSGFKQCPADLCGFIDGENSTTIVAVYVDDLIIIARNAEENISRKSCQVGSK